MVVVGGPLVKAMYPDHCNRCDDPIHKGEEIVLKRTALGTVIVHPRCASGQDE